MGFDEGSSLRGEMLVLAIYDECFKEIDPSDGNAYAVFSGKVRAEGHKRTIDCEPKEYDDKHCA